MDGDAYFYVGYIIIGLLIIVGLIATHHTREAFLLSGLWGITLFIISAMHGFVRSKDV